MRNSVATLFLALLTGNAMADWSVLNKGANATVYVDTSTIWRSGTTVKMWSLVDYTDPQDLGNGTSYLSDATLHEFDCREKKSRILQANAHKGQMREGDVMHSMGMGEWKYYPPGSIGDARREVACKKK